MNINPLINTYPANSKQKFRGQSNNNEEYRQRKLDDSQKTDKWDYRHSQPHTSLQCLTLNSNEITQKSALYGGLPCLVSGLAFALAGRYTKSSNLHKLFGKFMNISFLLAPINFLILSIFKYRKPGDESLRECGFKK